MQDKMIGKLSLIINHDCHPLNEISQAFVSTNSQCYKEYFKKYFFPSEIRFFNQCYIR